jgi:hypothetical protein
MPGSPRTSALPITADSSVTCPDHTLGCTSGSAAYSTDLYRTAGDDHSVTAAFVAVVASEYAVVWPRTSEAQDTMKRGAQRRL